MTTRSTVDARDYDDMPHSTTRVSRQPHTHTQMSPHTAPVGLTRSIYWYFVVIAVACAWYVRAFTGRIGRRHRLCGAAHLAVLSWRAFRSHDADVGVAIARLEDAALAVSGCILTASAYGDFAEAHARAKPNKASGTLHAKATVTGDEMLEHLFYQIVNAVQIAYLWHCDSEFFRSAGFAWRCAACAVATSPWLFRARFPVNSFSANYSEGALDFESTLYRLKKWQYVLYKTVILHGLNVSMIFAEDDDAYALVRSSGFRAFWLCLNAAYVLEFFLQTLVKRRYIHQRTMLALNQALMAISTYAVILVLRAVVISAAATCVVLNFKNRKREMQNVAWAIFVARALEISVEFDE